jgi:hypothetical protein
MTAPNIVHPVPSKPKSGASSTGSQRDRRFTDTFFDDYRHPRFPNGRPFTGQREYQSGSETESIAAGFLQSDLQCGEYFCDSPEHLGGTGQTEAERQATLNSVWVAPWLPKGGKKYMKFDYRRKRISFLYDTLIQDERTALARWWDAAAKAAGDNDVVDPTRPQAVSFRLKKLLGSPMVYLNEIRLATAAKAGDPWLMGAIDEPNEALAKLLGWGDVQYLGGVEFGDAEYVAVPQPRPAQPVLTPEQVLSVPMDQVQQMIEAALAKRDAEEAAKKEAAKAKMAKVRDSRKPAGSNAA